MGSKRDRIDLEFRPKKKQFVSKDSSLMGRKRDRVGSNFRPKKCAKRYIRSDDQISRLPDDILVDILSLLPVKEAERTSVLSSRWMNLWKHTTCLNLDGDRGLHKIEQQYKIGDKLTTASERSKYFYWVERVVIESERRKYVRWVNQVLRSHKSLTLKEFRVRFNLHMEAQKSITQWLEFAFTRKVQRLELDLQSHGDSSTFYRFPEELLAQSTGGASTLISHSDRFHTHHLCMLFDFKSLRALILRNVNVSGGAIDFFLHNCPLLEQLIVHRATKISNLEVCGSSLMLKHLEIVCCHGLKSLKISAPHLTYLRAATRNGFLLENAPMLVEIDCHCDDSDISLRRLFSTLSLCPQLKTLHLMMSSCGIRPHSNRETEELCDLPRLPKLKKLVIRYLGIYRRSLLRRAGFIRTSLCLEEFVLNYEWGRLPEEDREIKDVIMSPHHHLKVVKFCGYYGRISDLQFIEYILENCVVLEKLIIDPSCVRASRTNIVVVHTARKNAKQQLEARVPQHIELVIL